MSATASNSARRSGCAEGGALFLLGPVFACRRHEVLGELFTLSESGTFAPPACWLSSSMTALTATRCCSCCEARTRCAASSAVGGDRQRGDGAGGDAGHPAEAAAAAAAIVGDSGLDVAPDAALCEFAAAVERAERLGGAAAGRSFVLGHNQRSIAARTALIPWWRSERTVPSGLPIASAVCLVESPAASRSRIASR